jgi:GST-like protein
MLHLYTWRTPNGKKPTILLAELAIPYELHLVDLANGEQKRPEFLEVNPNGKIPALVDTDPELGRVVVFESGAVLVYLAEKYRRLLPHDLGAKRAEVLSWTFWQIGGPGPTFGKVGKFQKDKSGEAFTQFFEEAKRLVSVLDRRLVDRNFICTDYSIADIACYPWFAALEETCPEALAHAREVHRWMKRIGDRPAVRRGMHLEQVPRAA